METAIQVVWWIGLLGAAVLTVVILLQIALLLGILSDILELSQRTHQAARGVARHTAATPALEAAEEPARALQTAAGELAASARSIRRRLERLGA